MCGGFHAKFQVSRTNRKKSMQLFHPKSHLAVFATVWDSSVVQCIVLSNECKQIRSDLTKPVLGLKHKDKTGRTTLHCIGARPLLICFFSSHDDDDDDRQPTDTETDTTEPVQSGWNYLKIFRNVGSPAVQCSATTFQWSSDWCWCWRGPGRRGL